MARKRKHSRRRTRSHRRMSGVGAMRNIDFTNIAGIVAGAALAGYANKLFTETAKNSPKALAGGKVALGVALPMFIKNELVKGIGAGMIAVGSIDLLKSFEVIAGDFDIPVINGAEFGEDVLGGDFDIPVVNGAEFGEDVLGEDVLGEDDDML